MDILIADDFFDIRLHECSSESLCSSMNLGINWFQFWTSSSTIHCFTYNLSSQFFNRFYSYLFYGQNIFIFTDWLR